MKIITNVGSIDNTVKFWSEKTTLANCQQQIDKQQDIDDIFSTNKSHPNWFEEGAMISSSLTVCKQVFPIISFNWIKLSTSRFSAFLCVFNYRISL